MNQAAIQYKKPSLFTQAYAWRERARSSWFHASPRTRAIVQVSLLLAVVGIAYNYSLRTMLDTLGLETPLAYVSLVPLFALFIAWARRRPARAEPDIHDRQVDYIVGIPLLAIAWAINEYLPSKLSAMFWVWRIDLLTLPFFVAGAVSIIFGVRVLWRQKLAIGYLLLAWPYPYGTVFLRVLDGFTQATTWAMVHVASLTGVAAPTTSLSNTLFVVSHAGKKFPLDVVSACSGVNSVVGFLLVGLAFGPLVRGPLLRKSLWLVGGMLCVWFLNLIRLTLVFWAGHVWGENFAINVLHPFIGLVTFGVGVLLMVLLIRPLGMTIGNQEVANVNTEAAAARGTSRIKRSLAVPKVYLAATLVIVAALILGISNLGLRSYNLVADAAGEPRLVSYIYQPVAPAGWQPQYAATFDWAKPLFGSNSIWTRYAILPKVGTSASIDGFSLVTDVIDTPDLQAFSAFGVEQCYQFHGYTLSDVAQVALTGGITGQTMAYNSSVYGSWSIVYWILPVKAGTQTNYERVVIYSRNRPGQRIPLPPGTQVPKITNIAGSVDPILSQNRAFLVSFAKLMIQAQAHKSARVTTSSASA